MNSGHLLDAMGSIRDDYILQAKEGARVSVKTGNPRQRVRSLPRIMAIAAAVVVLLCLSAFAAYEMGVFDRWIQKPSNDPVASVRAAIENQKDKAYAIKIEIADIEIDQAETARMIQRITGSFIAEARGWSDEYLAEHFVAVRADYHAEYDHAKTNRSDGHVVQYFYLTEDPDSGEWTIIDNSGNQNWWESEPDQKPEPTVLASPREQAFSYLSGLFTAAYAPYYDGLHYEMNDYQETIAGGRYEAVFLWTMYYLGTGWDVSSDQNAEQEIYYQLKATAPIDGDGRLDVTAVTVLMDTSVEGPARYTEPVENLFPEQPS